MHPWKTDVIQIGWCFWKIYNTEIKHFFLHKEIHNKTFMEPLL